MQLSWVIAIISWIISNFNSNINFWDFGCFDLEKKKAKQNKRTLPVQNKYLLPFFWNFFSKLIKKHGWEFRLLFEIRKEKRKPELLLENWIVEKLNYWIKLCNQSSLKKKEEIHENKNKKIEKSVKETKMLLNICLFYS